MSKKSLVALAHGLDVQENVTRVFDMMGGAAKMIEPNSTVVLKPNAGHAAPPEFAVCTHPETVRAVIREVKKANPKRIVIAEAAAVGCDTDECYEACGIAAVAREEGVELVDIKKDKDLINVAVRGYRSNISHVKLPRLLLEAEHIINLPILKAHASMVFSGALKNIKGVVQDQVHVQMHQQNLTMAMMDVWWACRADINIMDVMHAASGYSPHTPVPIEVDCIMAPMTPWRWTASPASWWALIPTAWTTSAWPRRPGLGHHQPRRHRGGGRQGGRLHTRRCGSPTWRTSATAGPSMRSTVRAPAPAVRPC